MFTYENQGTSTYFVYQFQEEDQIDMLSIGMISNNSIKGVAPLVFTQMNTDKYVKFNVSSTVTLDKFLHGTVNRKRLLDVFKNICKTMLESEDYMLDITSFLWSTENIFVNVSTNDIAMICLPVLERQNVVDIKMFFKQIMFETKFDDTEDCSYVAKIVNYLNSVAVFTFESFKEELKSIEKENLNKGVQTTNVVKTVNQTSQTVSAIQQPVTQNTEQPTVPVQGGNGYSVAKVVEKQEQLKAERETAAAESSKTSNRFSIPGLTKKASEPKENGAASLFKKPDKKIEKLQEEKKSAGIFGGKKKSKEEMPSSMPMAPGFKVPGMGNQEDALYQSSIPPQSSLQREMPQANSAPVSATPTSQPAVQQTQPVVTSTVAQPQVVSKAANFGNTTVLNVPQNGATTVLDPSLVPGMGGTPKPYLIRKKNSETIPINKGEFRLGKERSFVDYFIGDNTAISRSHACIVCRENEYFVMDTNSTNHTFVNDIMIQSNVETKLESGMKIRLADEEFEFKMM